MAGKDSLSITCEVDADTLHAKCTEILAAFKKTHLPERIRLGRQYANRGEKDIIEQLDWKLFDAIEALATAISPISTWRRRRS